MERRLRIDVIVSVWGDWHVAAFQAATLPTALATGNLPALASAHQVRLRILTRRRDVERLSRMEALARLKAIMPVEITAMTEDDRVAAPFHLEWWHRAGRDAGARSAVALNLPPDVIFPDGSLSNLVAPLGGNAAAVLAPPQLRVVHETVLPELRRFADEPSGSVRISPRDTVALGIRHLHPLFAEVVDGNPFGRPGIEHLWPVGDEGFVLCQTTREIIAYNPALCDITDRFLMSNAVDMSTVHTSTSAEDSFFLSLAPLAKDFGLVLRNHPAAARFLARWSTHPDNDVPLAEVLAERLVRLEAKQPTPGLWQIAENRAKQWVHEYRQWRKVFHLWRAAREAGCSTAGRLIGLAVQTMELHSFFGASNSVSAFLPTEEVFAQLGPGYLHAMAAEGGQQGLADFLRAHLVEIDAERLVPGRPVTLQTMAGRSEKLALTPQGGQLGARAVEGPVRLGRCAVYRMHGILR